MRKQICRQLYKEQQNSLQPTQKLTFSSENGKLLVRAIVSGFLEDREEKIHIPYEFTEEETEGFRAFHRMKREYT